MPCIQHPISKLTYSTRGFSLISMLVALSIIAISSWLAIPRLSETFLKMKHYRYLEELRRFIRLTRAMAISHQKVTLLCPRVTNENKADRVSSIIVCGKDWQNGLQIWIANGNRRIKLGDTAQLLYTLAGTTTAKINWRASGGRKFLRFSSSGAALEFGSFYYCPETQFSGQYLRVNRQGRVLDWKATDDNTHLCR